MYSGQIKSRGPRYCPSIEDKIVRFGERDGHQIFLEPEGLDDTTVYPNGISTSLPEDVQPRSSPPFPGWIAPASCARAMRSNTITSIRASCIRRWRRSGCRAFSLPARSTARPVTRRPPRRAWSPASTLLRGRRRGAYRVRSRRGLSRRHGRRPRHARRHRAVPDVYVTRGVPVDTARRQCRSAADRQGIALGCVGAERARSHRTKMAALEAARGLAQASA